MKKLFSINGWWVLLIMAATLFASCENDEIPVTTWRTTGVHRIEVEFSDTTDWIGQCVFTAGFFKDMKKTLFEDGVRLNTTSEMYVEKKLRNYNVFSEEKCNVMAAGVSAFATSRYAKPLTIILRGYIDGKLTNTIKYMFLPKMEVMDLEFYTEEKHRIGEVNNM